MFWKSEKCLLALSHLHTTLQSRCPQSCSYCLLVLNLSWIYCFSPAFESSPSRSPSAQSLLPESEFLRLWLPTTQLLIIARILQFIFGVVYMMHFKTTIELNDGIRGYTWFRFIPMKY